MRTKKRFRGSTEVAKAALGIGFAIILVAMLVAVLGGFRGTQCTDGTIGRYNFTYDVCCTTVYSALNTCNATSSTVGQDFNVTTQGMSGLSQYNNWWTILVLLSIFGVVIAVLTGRKLMSGSGL